MENNTIVTLKPGEGRSFKAGGLWIYDNEIAAIQGTFKNGAVVSCLLYTSIETPGRIRYTV